MKAAKKETEELKAALYSKEQKETQEKAIDKAREPLIDLDVKETEYMDLVLAGDTASALDIRKEIRAEERRLLRVEADDAALSTNREGREQDNLNARGLELETEFPFLVEGSDDFDSDVLDEIGTVYGGFYNRGNISQADAIEKATRLVIAARGLAPDSEVDSGYAKDPNSKARIKSSKKKAKLAKQQPHKTPSHNTNLDVDTDIATMSDEEFDAMPEAAKRRLRGDYA